jgi:MSHA pilin protein MshD
MFIPSDSRDSRRPSRGLSLIELVVFIVIVSAAVAGIVGVISVTTRASVDPLIHKQALAIAEAVLEEVQLQPFTYCDPDDPGAATASAGGSALSLDAVTPGGGTGNPVDVTHTIGGTSRYVFVHVVSSNTFPTISSVVWDPTGVNEPLSLIASANYAADARSAVYGRVNPTAKTATMRVTLSAGDGSGTYVAVASFKGVHQTTPLGTPATANGGAGGTPTVTVSAAVGDLVVDFMGTKETPTGNKTPGAGQTELWDGFSTQSIGAGSTEAGAASVQMTWGGTTEEWAMVGVALKPGGSCPLLAEAIGPEPGETRYSSTLPFDNVNDYHGFDTNTATPSGIRSINSTLIAGLDGYRVTVSVAGQTLGGIGNDAYGNPQSLLITVTVTGPGNTTVTLHGYRTRYAPNDLP